MTDTGKCPIVVHHDRGWGSNTCDRPIKRDGLCGLHAAAKDKRAANDRAATEKREASEARRDEALRALAELGIEGTADYAYSGRYTGNVVVSIETLRELAERLPSHG